MIKNRTNTNVLTCNIKGGVFSDCPKVVLKNNTIEIKVGLHLR